MGSLGSQVFALGIRHHVLQLQLTAGCSMRLLSLCIVKLSAAQQAHVFCVYVYVWVCVYVLCMWCLCVCVYMSVCLCACYMCMCVFVFCFFKTEILCIVLAVLERE